MEAIEAEYSKQILQAIKDVRNNNIDTILFTYRNEKPQIMNIETDLGDLRKVQFGPKHIEIIIFETGLTLFIRKIEKIETIEIKETIFSKNE